jgi:hypothetical protein
VSRRAPIALVFLAIAIAVGCSAPAEGELDEPISETTEAVTTPEITRAEIMALAESGVGYSYWWGGGRWDPAGKSHPGKCSGSCPGCSHWAHPSGGPEYGADCSGYVGQVWQVPNRQPPTGPRPPYSTYHFKNQQTHWFPINRSELEQGDALVYNNGSAGHIVLFDHWSAGGNAVVYECAGCVTGCVHRSRSVGPAYIAIRRRGLDAAPVNEAAEGQLDQANCNGIQGWARDPDAPNQPVDVVLSFGGSIRNQNAVTITIPADEYRKDLCSELGSCEHAFSASIPASLKDGKRRSVYAYSVDKQTNEKKLLIGAPRSFQCGTAPTSTGKCAHGNCEQGGPMNPKCSPCSNAVCAQRPECCDANGTWDATCVEIAGNTPGACAGVCYNAITSCSHSECVEGELLPTSCSTCAASVCERDPYCCEKKWDWICASGAKRDAYCLCK